MPQLATLTDPAGVDVECPGAVRLDVGRDRPDQRLAGHDDRLPTGLECSSPPGPGRPGRTADGLGDVERLREPGAVQPHDRVSDLEPGVFERAHQTVPGSCATEREQVSARFEDTERFN